jgi:pyrimidine 5'-nucleotidase
MGCCHSHGHEGHEGHKGGIPTCPPSCPGPEPPYAGRAGRGVGFGGCCGAGAGAGAGVGVSSVDLCAVEVLFFDCDDTLYQNAWRTAERLKKSIDEYTTQELHLAPDVSYRLYKEHGTALRGLIKEHLLPEDQVERFLSKVHDVSLEDITARPALREMLLRLGHKRRFVYTASTREHAMRCLHIIGIADLFEDVIDCRAVGLHTKHDPISFVLAMKRANVADPALCMMLDDSTRNLETAKSLGLVTCLVGTKDRESGRAIQCASADIMVDDLLELPRTAPGLFDAGPHRVVSVSSKNQNQQSPKKAAAARAIEAETNAQEIAPLRDALPAATPLRRMVAVLGGPGSGKGTQCERILREFPNIAHLSAGDLLREEQKDPTSTHGATILHHIREGTLVPHEITMSLLLNAMRNSDKTVFLIDGCPRDEGNKRCFEATLIAPGHAQLVGVLFYECTEQLMLDRILARAKTSGRADDNVDSAKKRFKTFATATKPVVDEYREANLLYEIDAMRTVDAVFQDTKQSLQVMLLGSDGQAAERRSLHVSARINVQNITAALKK